jgi:ABC-type nitrate/sulfonate/bicarbonate transport system substrate-binding protein
MKIAIPDIISNSYIPALAAIELGFCQAEGLDLTIEHLFPLGRAFEALRDGTVDFVATSAHGALSAFPNWRGCQLLCAQSQGMYWFLVMRADLGAQRNDLSIVTGKTIGAAPWADDGLKAILREAGVDTTGTVIGPPAIAMRPGVSFGIAMAAALRDGTIDGFWANGVAAELAVRSGAGTLVLDVRRGDGPQAAFGYTQPSIITTDRLVEAAPDAAAAMVRAIVAVQTALRADPDLVSALGQKLFPAAEAAIIQDVVVRDLPYYRAAIAPHSIDSMIRFAEGLGQVTAPVTYGEIVATRFSSLWS